ncbi:ribonuclease-3 [Methanolinea mesophila]|uniref:ribonuclease III n=1 Tax=Methanolinea mesophila TaxID=547055 RepID=UPI001AE41C54|nr:ribonuclease III [Methanolinea mesophila]MBP1927582.1 ribonuclease-3 [Methanolinea mesophila]
MEENRRKELEKLLFLPEIGLKEISVEDLELYDRALTHRSATPGDQGTAGVEANNERLEFLGDRVLNLIVAEHLYRADHLSEGEMTQRMEVTMNQNLAAIVPTMGIGLETLIRLGPGQEPNSRIIAGAFEAFIGALYLNLGMRQTKKIVLGVLNDELKNFSAERNHKKKLQEFLQKHHRPIPVYRFTSQDGPDHRPVFTYHVLIEGTLYGEGVGSSKAEATQNAAQSALERIRNGK